ncbi:hypothetical protein DPMN_105730 [Dreissena polymorpha]|uniref:BED-type domain-containing protein n=1 Tax=Dreissena polymorpha TaxID=45954 RepID=A0A9D4K3Q9_DREPO|nr:hypothetical protein DPMN_105730 [Dreissena polymorpha]
MKPKDPVWGLYHLLTGGNKTVAKCKECSLEVSAKVIRFRTHLQKCKSNGNGISASSVMHAGETVLVESTPAPVPTKSNPQPETPKKPETAVIKQLWCCDKYHHA